jgi:hypothetical protein
MPYLLRAIHDRINWDPQQFPNWVKNDDLPSCIICDLDAGDNELSLWEVTDNEDNLQDVITAIVSRSRGHKSYFDYALLKEEIIDEPSFQLSIADGDTAYSLANKYHRNLVNVSLHTAVYFAHTIHKNADFRRASWKEIKSWLLQAHKNEKLEVEKMPKPLRSELGI